MTVCAAAISKHTVIGASDRMLTSGLGDIQFEPQISKLVKIAENACVMVAGDMTLQTEIINSLMSRLGSFETTDHRVGDLADLYYSFYLESRAKKVKWAILRPLGFDTPNDVIGHGELGLRVAADIVGFRMPEIEAIIAGSDDAGAHIYVATNQGVTCHDGVGFASIGGGAGHANSQFMFSGHNRYRELAETLMLVYSAKKRAEVAPGVGTATDMFLIEPPATYVNLGTHILENLQRIHMEMTAKAEQAKEDAYGAIREYLRIIIEGDGPSVETTSADTTEEDGQGLPRSENS